MPAPKICVLRAPGTNCDSETAFAFDSCGGSADRIHLFQLLEQPELLDAFQILCIPGGFSYGDDIGAGVVFASQLRGHLGDAMRRFLNAEKLVLGICNGFQTLLKAGILPGGSATSLDAERDQAEASLTWNLNGKYTARWVHLKVSTTNNVFLRGIEEIDLPIAHAEGRIVVRCEQVLNDWKQQRQIAARRLCGLDGTHRWSGFKSDQRTLDRESERIDMGHCRFGRPVGACPGTDAASRTISVWDPASPVDQTGIDRPRRWRRIFKTRLTTSIESRVEDHGIIHPRFQRRRKRSGRSTAEAQRVSAAEVVSWRTSDRVKAARTESGPSVLTIGERDRMRQPTQHSAYPHRVRNKSSTSIARHAESAILFNSRTESDSSK